MSEQYTITNRRRNIEELLQLIKDGEKDKDRLVSRFCLRKGLAEKTVYAYLDLLIKSGKVYLSNEELKSNEN